MSAAAAGATTVLLEEIRARRERDEKAWADRQYKRAAARADRQRQDLFDEGRREERSRTKTKSGSRSRPASGRRTSTRSTRRRRAPATVRTATRQLARPVRAQAASAMHAFGLTLVVVVIFQVLRHAEAVDGALGGLSRGLEWLSAPDKSIPYAGSS